MQNAWKGREGHLDRYINFQSGKWLRKFELCIFYTNYKLAELQNKSYNYISLPIFLLHILFIYLCSQRYFHFFHEGQIDFFRGFSVGKNIFTRGRFVTYLFNIYVQRPGSWPIWIQFPQEEVCAGNESTIGNIKFSFYRLSIKTFFKVLLFVLTPFKLAFLKNKE